MLFSNKLFMLSAAKNISVSQPKQMGHIWGADEIEDRQLMAKIREESKSHNEGEENGEVETPHA